MRTGFSSKAKHFARRGIKGESGGNSIQGMGAIDGGTKNCLMAKMDAIEVADGKDAGVAKSGVAGSPGL